MRRWNNTQQNPKENNLVLGEGGNNNVKMAQKVFSDLMLGE